MLKLKEITYHIDDLIIGGRKVKGWAVENDAFPFCIRLSNDGRMVADDFFTGYRFGARSLQEFDDYPKTLFAEEAYKVAKKAKDSGVYERAMKLWKSGVL